LFDQPIVSFALFAEAPQRWELLETAPVIPEDPLSAGHLIAEIVVGLGLGLAF
jgi:hypothetical protein